MRKKNSIVSYFCGILFRSRPPAVEDDDDDDPVDMPGTPSSSGRGDGTLSPVKKPCSPKPQQQPLPPPPGNGNFHMRTVSCGHNLQRHRRSNSGVSRLVSSMNLRVTGGGGGGGSIREERPRTKERTKYFKPEDSVWKKTIILGERCRVPEKDDDGVNLYDEKGNEIRTYRPKTYSGLIQYSRQNSSLDLDRKE